MAELVNHQIPHEPRLQQQQACIHADRPCRRTASPACPLKAHLKLPGRFAHPPCLIEQPGF